MGSPRERRVRGRERGLQRGQPGLGERMASLLQCYCRQGPAVGPGSAGRGAAAEPEGAGPGGSHVGRGLVPSALLLGDGVSRGAPAPLLGITRGQEQGWAGAGVPLLAHEGEDPVGRAGSVPMGTTPGPWGSSPCPHRFLVSGGMTASARRFL